MSNIDAEDLKQFNIDLEKDLRRLHSKIPPPNNISETDIYIRNVNQEKTFSYLSFFNIRDLLEGPWKVYRNSSGRQFYHNRDLQISSWKPPRKYKQTGTIVRSEETIATQAVREAGGSTVRDIEAQEVVIPGGFEEFHDKVSGIKNYMYRGFNDLGII